MRKARDRLNTNVQPRAFRLVLVNTTDLLQKALLKATGKFKALTPSDPKWSALLAHANILIDTWAREPGANWQSLYEPDYVVGTASTSRSYDLDEDIIGISTAYDDYVRIKDVNNPTRYFHFKTVLPESLKSANHKACARIGNTLRFNFDILPTSAEFGGQILAPVYLTPEPLAKPNDTVPVDDPNWLVVMVAAAHALSKRNLESKYPLLITEANSLMAGMKANNEAQSAEIYREPIGIATEW